VQFVLACAPSVIVQHKSPLTPSSRTCPNPLPFRFSTLKAQYATIRDEIRAAVDSVLESQQCILGPGRERLRSQAGRSIAAAHTRSPFHRAADALLVSLMAENIGPGDEVITTPYTFFATAGAIARLGAKTGLRRHRPADLQHRSRADRVEGHPAYEGDSAGPSLRPVRRHGSDHGRRQSARHSRGRRRRPRRSAQEYKGRRAGSIGRYGCFSFFPSKNLGAAGDGGLVTACDAAVPKNYASSAHTDQSPSTTHAMIGGKLPLRRPAGRSSCPVQS